MKKQISIALALVWMLASCTPALQPTQMPPPTLPPTWGIEDFINPSTIQDYINTVHLDQTTRIEFLSPITGEQVVITTQLAIQGIVELLGSTMDNCAGTPENNDYAILILMTVPAEGGEHLVSVDYRPETSDVLLDNIPTGSWPIKIQGSYSVCPDFGKSLFDLLGIDGSTATTQPLDQVLPASFDLNDPAVQPILKSSWFRT
jgi:hypothetical protein